MSSLLTKHRPTKFSEVVGQDAVVRSLKAAIESKAGRAFLFTGPSGVGKTTLSYIVAAACGVHEQAISEIDAATHTSVDDMRSICGDLAYFSLFGGRNRAVILDECHMLSKNAWNSLLKSLEQPPNHVWWFLCTTEPNKVPNTIITRCLRYDLKLVPSKVLGELYDYVAKQEKIDLPGDVADLLIKRAEGSPRQLLANLAICLEAEDREEAAELLRTADEGSPEIIDFVRTLYGNRWKFGELVHMIRDLGDVNAESVRRVVLAYGTKIVFNSQDNKQTNWALRVLRGFQQPFRDEGLTPVLMACDSLLED